jgi:hypothetical protein
MGTLGRHAARMHAADARGEPPECDALRATQLQACPEVSQAVMVRSGGGAVASGDAFPT